MKHWGKLLLFAAVACFIASCTKDPIPLDKALAKQWNFVSIDGGSTYQADSSDHITLASTPDANTFEYHLKSQGINKKGVWTIADSTATLVVDADPMLKDIDSTVYQVENNQPLLILYKNGEEVSRVADNQLSIEREVIELAIKECTFDKVVFESAGATYTMEYRPEVVESNLSITGILRGLLGMLVLLGIAFLFSANRKAINWALVGKGLLIQLTFAILVLKVPFVAAGFEGISSAFVTLIDYTQEGTKFLFNSFVSGEIESPMINFAIMVLPTIIFFSALTSLFYYFGILQKVVYAFAWVMKRVMKLSGAESLAAAGNIFLGQTESPLLIRPYLDKMTKSEIMCLMSGGMATIAGGVLAAYIGFLGGGDPAQELFFAKHLLAASVMSAPAAIVAAKILVPETEEFDSTMKVPKEKIGANALEAIANGTTDGLKLAINVGAMLLVFTALMALGNGLLEWLGGWTGLNSVIAANTDFDGLSFQFLLGYACAPITWLMGVPQEDMVLVGQLLGEKTVLNEFYAYVTLGDLKANGAFHSEKSIMMATYILCGFANFASIGIQIGGIGALVPTRKGLLSKLGVRALIGGTLACLFTAVIVGMLY